MSNIVKKEEGEKSLSDILREAEKSLGRPLAGKAFVPKKDQTVYLLIDCSGSMSEDIEIKEAERTRVVNKMKEAKKGALGFAEDALSQRYKVGIIAFKSSAYLVCEAGSVYRDISSKIEHLSANGSTNMTSALEIVVEKLNAVSGTKVICVVTDGVADNPTSTLKIADYAKSLGIGIMTIGTGDADASFLAKLASQSNLTSKVESKDLEKAITNMARLLPS